jgi:hypothetical protein
MPVIIATQEVEIRRMEVHLRSALAKNLQETISTNKS